MAMFEYTTKVEILKVLIEILKELRLLGRLWKLRKSNISGIPEGRRNRMGS